MSDIDQELLLGRLAVHFKMLSKARLVEVIQEQRRESSGLALGAFLVSKGVISPEQRTSLDAARRQYNERQSSARAAAETPPAPAARPEPVRSTAETTPMGAIPQAPPVTADPAEASSAETAPSVPAVAPLPVPVKPLPPAPRAPATAPEAEAKPDPAFSEPLAAVPVSADPAVAESVAPEPVAAEPVAPEPVMADAGAPEPVMAEAGAADQPAPQMSYAVASEPEAVPAVEAFPEPTVAPRTGALPYRPDVDLDELLRAAVAMRASDVHIHSGAPIKVRLDGSLRDATDRPLGREEAERLIRGLLGDERWQRFESARQLDFAHQIEGVARFRANAYRQQRGCDAVFRAIPVNPPSLEDLGLPFELGAVSQYHQGLVLFTGPAGCGKSSTMAAMVELANQRRTDHVLTVEDPIEFLFESKKCLVNQRQVGPHTESFGRALRAALREDPDIVVIGELRDLETISLALTAAETGHLVLGTLHTSGAIRTVNRLLGVFPPDQQSQIRTMVSESLRAIISQRLVARADGQGRIPALEVLYNNKAIGNLIRENKTFQLRSVMQTGASAGMCLLDASLVQLVKTGKVTIEEARRHAEEPAKLG